MPVVAASHLPAPLPMPEMAGVISAKISTGMKNPRKLPKRPLKVTKTLAMLSGRIWLPMIPSTIAMTILNSSALLSRLKSMLMALNILKV